MSLQAVVWVIEDAPDLEDRPRLVATLSGLANHAQHDGTGSYAGVPLLAWYARKSERQVQRDIGELLDLGLIRLGDQRMVLHIPADKRPTVYDLAVERRRPARKTDPGDAESPAQVAAVDNASGVTSMSPRQGERGDMGVASGVTWVSPKPSLEPTTPYIPGTPGTKRCAACTQNPARSCRRCGTSPRTAAAAADRAARRRPEWCGADDCSEATRMRDGPGLTARPYRCPACHPNPTGSRTTA